MQEKQSLQETLQPYVEKLLKGLEQGVDYATQEIPIVLQQYVLYEAITSWLLVLLYVGLIIGLYKLSKFMVKLEECKEPYLINILSFIFLSFIIKELGVAIKCTFFPKLFLLEEFIKIF